MTSTSGAPDGAGVDEAGAPFDLLVTGVTALVHDDAGEVAFLDDAAIAVTDGAIAAVGPAGEVARGAARASAGEVIDARGQLAVPGLVNCHTHAAMVLFRGAAEDVPLTSWFNDHIWPMEVNLTPRDVELGALLACAEMIAGGTTAFADHYFAMDGVAAAVEASGLRANLGWAYFSSDGAAGRERGLDFALRLRGGAGGRITTSLAPHAPYTVDEADLAATAALAARHELLVHVHAAETPHQTAASLARTGATPLEVLRRAGLLEGPLLLAHGTGIVGEDLPALAAAADRVAVATSPRFYLKAAQRTTPIRALSGIGVPVGLATDGAASNGDLDLWTTLLTTSLSQKSAEGDPTWMTSRRVLRHATTESAAALRLGPSSATPVGRLAKGFRADIALLDLGAPHLQPVHDLAATLVHSARAADVVTTIVDGRVLMRDRRLLTVDVPAVLAELTPRLAALTRRDGVQRLQTYRP